MIDVLFEGAHTNHYHEDGHYSIDPLGSSVTLIQINGFNILYDTSSMAFNERLQQALKERSLAPADIQHVINSHYHLDHCFNNYLFARTAEMHTAHATLKKDGSAHIYPDPSVRLLPKGIELVKTPGHTGTDVSLVYEWEGKTWMCVGDAVREDIIRGESRLTAAQPERFIESMKLIFERADIIVPGHGPIIQGTHKDELKSLIHQLTLPNHVVD